jgi:hypothetical protein
VVKSREAQWRPVRLEPAPLRRVDEWMATYRAFFEERFDRLDEQLTAMVATSGSTLRARADDGEALSSRPGGRAAHPPAPSAAGSH